MFEVKRWHFGLSALLDIGYVVSVVLAIEYWQLSYAAILGLTATGIAIYLWLYRLNRMDSKPWLLATAVVAPFSTILIITSKLEANPEADLIDGSESLKKRFLVAFMCLPFMVITATGTFNKHILDPAHSPIEDQAKSTLNRSLVLAAASYASARVIDRVISMATEVQTGAGVSLKPFQFMKPIQDMAVRYSDIMVLAMASVGIQIFLLELGRVAAAPLFGTASLGLLAAFLLCSGSLKRSLFLLLKACVSIILVLKVGIPAAVLTVGLISTSILDEPRNAAEAGIVEVSSELDDSMDESDSGGIRNFISGVAGSASEVIEGARAITDDVVERFVQLIVVYILETLILPIAVLYGLWKLTTLVLYPGYGIINTVT